MSAAIAVLPPNRSAEFPEHRQKAIRAPQCRWGGDMQPFGNMMQPDSVGIFGKNRLSKDMDLADANAAIIHHPGRDFFSALWLLPQPVTTQFTGDGFYLLC